MGFTVGTVAGLVLCVALALGFGVRARRRGASRGATLLACLLLLGGSVTALLAMLHLVTVISLRVAAWRHGGSFGYDFRLYSLLLFGVVLFSAGASLARRAAGLSSGDPAAFRGALVTLLVLLAVNVPLAPLQPFAVGLAILALCLLVVLIAAKSVFRHRAR